MSWGMGGVPKPSDRTGNNNTSRNNNRKVQEEKEEFKTQQMKNLEAYKAKYANMNLGQALQLLSDTEDSRQNPNYRPLNLNQFLQQKGVSSDPNVPVLAFQAQSVQDVQIPIPIDLTKIRSTQDLINSQDSGARARMEAIAEREFIKQEFNIESIPESRSETRGTRASVAGGAGVANLGLSNRTTPFTYTEIIAGRNITKNLVQKPIEEQIKKEIIKEQIEEPKIDYSRPLLIGGIALAVLLSIIIWRIKN